MRTLILGGTGMLGRALVAAARHRGFPALALSHAQADVTDRARLLYWVREFRPEVVVNAAAYTQVDRAESEREAAFAVNGTALDAVAAAAAASPVGGRGEKAGAVLLHVSTDYVFDGTATLPYREDAPTAPRSVYGASKRDGEIRALGYPKALVVRTSWLFGPGGPNFAATIHGLLAAGKPLKVVDDQHGGPTYTPYLADALLDLAPRGERGILHYRNREPVTWFGFAQAIARLGFSAAKAAAIVPVTTAEFPRPAPRPAYSVLDVGRFEAIVGRPVEAWERGLAAYLPPI